MEKFPKEVPTVEIHRHLLSFRDWQIFGKRYLDELTSEEMEHFQKLHPVELDESTNSTKYQLKD